MNTVRLGLKSFTFLLVRCGSLSAAAPPALGRCDCRSLRTVFQCVRTMASISNNNNNPEMRPGMKKARQREPLRRVKTKENRGKKRELHGPSTVYLQVVGAGSRDNNASLYVFSEYNR